MNASSTNKMNTEKSGVVYVGIPLAHGGALATSVSSHVATEPAPSKFKSCSGRGLLAFFIGVALACFAWVANQGWTITSLLLFGQFTWTLQSAWKHVLLCLLASFCTSVAFWAVFKMIFPRAIEDDEDVDEDEVNQEKKCQREISDSLQDLGELGFLIGYFGSQTLLKTIVYKPLTAFGIQYDEQSNVAFSGATLVFVMLWMLWTKMRDYNRAVKRANNAQCEATLQIV